jgi:hypothetical protein
MDDFSRIMKYYNVASFQIYFFLVLFRLQQEIIYKENRNLWLKNK